MKVLIYEPMLHGHRGVLLRYYCGALAGGGYEVEVCTEMLPEHETPGLIDALDARARAAGCDIIHVLTFEGLGPKWMRYPHFSRTGRPVVASYYLYNNLYGFWKGLPWDVLFARGLLNRVLISDDFLAERSMPVWRQRRISYVPDPWDPQEFPPVAKTEARKLLGMPEDRKILLVFGALKPRKGLELLFEAVKRLGDEGGRSLVVLAGVLDAYYRTGPAAPLVRALQSANLLRVDDYFIDENQVSAYFHAADFVVCPYPHSFQASSNVFTRACAAGTPSIVPDHGVMGEIVKRTGAGILFQTESIDDLARCLRHSLNMSADGGIQDVIRAGRRVAETKRLENFEQAVLEAYQMIGTGK